MEKKIPLISICIPTYNRADVLEKTLKQLVNDKGFDEEIEIVISDNASTDNTKQICESFVSIYPNVKYFQNTENIKDQNFPLSLDRATGRYLKLMKDNIDYSIGALSYMKDKINKHLIDKTPILFTNGLLFNEQKIDEYLCKSFEDFITHVSYQVTAIAIFGCWKEDWKLVEEKQKYSRLQLAQDDWIYQIVERNKKVRLCTKKIYRMFDLNTKSRSGYNWFNVHVSNYYTILQSYIDKGLVSDKSLKIEKKTYLKALKPALVYTYLCKNIFPSWNFDTKGSFSILWKHFKDIPYLYVLIITFPIWGLWIIAKYSLIRIIVLLGLWDFVKRKFLP